MAHTDAVIASIITLTSVGLTFIAIIGYLVYVSKQKKKYKLLTLERAAILITQQKGKLKM